MFHIQGQPQALDPQNLTIHKTKLSALILFPSFPSHSMPPTTGVDTAQIREKALADLLAILEGVHHPYILTAPGVEPVAKQLMYIQVRGKKTLVLDQSLSGPIGLFAKFSVLQVQILKSYIPEQSKKLRSFRTMVSTKYTGFTTLLVISLKRIYYI